MAHKEHEHKYLILSSLAKDYLGCTASSSAVEQTFSAAADVCSSARGKLLPRTIERSVSSRMWLHENIPLGGYFDGAKKQIENFQLFCDDQDSRRKKIEKKSRIISHHTLKQSSKEFHQ